MVTPQAASRSTSFSRGLVLQKEKVEGVTTDLDPVKKHLEESSGQFPTGADLFSNYGVAHIFDPGSLCKLAGSTIVCTKLVRHVVSKKTL